MKFNFDLIEHTSPFTVGVDTKRGYGYFEHVVHGDDCAGGLWFEGSRLVDYDGVCQLPDTVVNILKRMGFDTGDAK